MIKNRGIIYFVIFVMVLALTSLSCEVANLPFLATETPTPTATFTPSPTPTPSSTPTLTPTSTPLPTGRVKEEQADGTTVFIDYDGGYQVTFPQNWIPVISVEEDIEDIINSLPEQEQNISDIMEMAKNTGGEAYRVFALNFKAQEKIYTPNINISYQEDAIFSAVPMEDLIAANLEFLPSLGIEVVSSGVKNTSSGIETGFMDVKWALKITENQKINLIQRQIYFKSGKGMAVITISTTRENPFDLSSDIDQLIESIQLLNN
jgi:hypothetical protein